MALLNKIEEILKNKNKNPIAISLHRSKVRGLMNIKITDHSKIPVEFNIWKERPEYLAKDCKLKLLITSDTVIFKRLVLNSFIPS